MLKNNNHISDYAVRNFTTFAYRKNGLVYLPSLKSACTYYYTLCLANGFERIYFQQIEWDKDHVVGFIMEPIKRYFKGVIEDIFQSDSDEYQNLIFTLIEKYNGLCFPMSGHCMPISITLKDYAYKVDWIPLYEDHIPSHKLFKKLCREYDIEIIDAGENIDSHESNYYKTAMFEKIYKFKDNFNDSFSAWFLNIAEDLDLYYNVVAKINPNGEKWKDISWLRLVDSNSTNIEVHNIPIKLDECFCEICQKASVQEIKSYRIANKVWEFPTIAQRKIKCSMCNSNTCPKAQDHNNLCAKYKI